MTVLAGMCRLEVTLTPPSGVGNSWGAVAPGAGVVHPAFISYGVRRVLGFDGKETSSDSRVTIPYDVAVVPGTLITLPAGMKPQSPPIVGVSKPSEPGAIHHTVIHLGGRS